MKSTTIRPVVLAVLFAAWLAVLAACTTGAGGAQSVNLTGTDTMRFEPAPFTVKAGQPVTVTLQNNGSLVHSFDLTEGVAQPVALVVQGGQSGQVTFTIEQPGTYTFVCNQPGHAEAGMTGTITAQ